MKRFLVWLLAIALVFSGCAAAQDDPFRVDTVVQIPVDPTDAPTEVPAEPETEEHTEEPTEAPTEPKEATAPKTTTSYKGSSSGKGSSSSQNSSSGKNQSSKDQKSKETEPPAAETVPVETIPPTEAPTEPPYDPSSYGVGGLEYAILDELNAYRAEEGVAELSLSGRLSGIAYLRAQESTGAWGHTRPDGRDYTSALSDYGYGYGAAAELSVYVADGDAASIVSKWMNAKSHSKNVLSDSFSTAGIGVYSSGGMTYVVCLLVG